jgi:membrane protein YdbS with pleckstrin-like domain
MRTTDSEQTHGAEHQPLGESVIWSGRPSQLVNVIPFVFSIALCGALAVAMTRIGAVYDVSAHPYAQTILVCLPLLYAFSKWLAVRFEIKIVTTKRIKIRKSIWNSGMRPVQLFRVKDHDYDEPWYWKPFGLGTVTLQTSDHSDPTVRIHAIKRARELHDEIERLVVQERRGQGVQEIDYIA